MGRYLLTFILVLASLFLARRDAVPGPRPADHHAGTTARVFSDPVASIAAANSPPAAPPHAPPGPVPLFRYVPRADWAALAAALPAPSQEIHYVRIDPEVVSGKPSPFWQRPGAGRLAIPLPHGGALTIVIDDSRMLGAGRFVSRGRIEGRPASRAVFAAAGGFLQASIDDPELGSFALRTATSEVAQFFQTDPQQLLRCGGERPPPIDGPALLARAGGTANPGAVEPPAPLTANLERPAGPEVHVLMAYTQDAQPTMTGAARTAAIQSACDLAIEKANIAFEVSRITARLKLVRIAEVTYDESVSEPASVQDDALTALYRTNDGKMDEIHALRDQAGADVVCLAVSRRDSASSGLAFLLTDAGDLANPLFAFAVVHYSQIVPSTVVAHELGHLFGCAHERLDYFADGRPPTPGRHPYSYGYRFRAASGALFHDIMAYPPGVEIGYFSNPRISAPVPAPDGSAGGIDAGMPGETDTSRTIEDAAFEVAGYRLQTQSAPNAGTLINVATRAYVGRDDQVLIGGFVVEGTQPKRMLVRAAGPALAAFGVAEPLADPVLRVVASGGREDWRNDDWSVQTGAAEIVTAGAQVGAFPFATGSRDAALLLTLPPGGYSAVVEGAGGTTGAGLVEAYQVEHSTTRIINLATRGYADNTGHEMVAGFVVQAAPGATKRILVRVLGPTLGRAPFQLSGVLFDPFLELRGGDGRALVENDDWSSGAREVDGERDDFQPLVRYYREEQIAATGFAPTNRREPCVMADLPAGNYTVIVKPFEHRDVNPLLDQPAQPGVGIVEVYEISR
ncbi:MAG: zinc-dependent metalloprotease family protein [Opitutaceae bacterium]|nr:zinc-dependent metalloprotease family protein [Opitutaceae bacterium]